MNIRKRRRILNQNSDILGARLREARERAGYKTLGQLWDAIRERGANVIPQYIGQLESGKGTPSFETLAMILDACGVTVADFLGSDLDIQEDATILGVGLEQRGSKRATRHLESCGGLSRNVEATSRGST